MNLEEYKKLEKELKIDLSKLQKTADDINTIFEIDDRYEFKTLFYKVKLRLVKYDSTKNVLSVQLFKMHKFFSFISKVLNPEKDFNLYKVLIVNWLHRKINISISVDNIDYGIVNKLYKTNYN